MTRLLRFLAFTWVAALAAPAFADPLLVRQDCTGVDRCHTTIAAAVQWLLANEPPSAQDPAVVDIGPGSFDGITCIGYGHVTFRGVSRTTTTVGAVNVWDCASLAFERLAVKSTGTGVYWIAGGGSSWLYVDIVAPKPWYDINCSAVATSHQFRGSRWIGDLRSDASVRLLCGTMQFALGEIRIGGAGTQPASGAAHYAVAIGGRGVLYIEDSAIRVSQGAWTGNPSSADVVAVSVGRAFTAAPSGTPSLAMLGGVINASLPGLADGDVTSIETVGSAAWVSTPGAAFVLEPGAAGASRRIVRGSASHTVNSSFLWPAHAAPPAIASVDGLDTAVETDCHPGNGGCTGGDEAHLLEYRSAQCGSSNPWYDLVTKACRIP